MDSSVTLATLNKHSEHVQLYDVYNPGMEFGGQIIITDLGIWNIADYHYKNIKIELSKYLQRKDMTGINLRVATMVGNLIILILN